MITILLIIFELILINIFIIEDELKKLERISIYIGIIAIGIFLSIIGGV